MSEATLTNPRVRATTNRWYLFLDRDPAYGHDGHARAVIEEIVDEFYSGDGGPTRKRRRAFIDTATLDDQGYREIGWQIENEIDDAEFQRFIGEGTIIPITSTLSVDPSP